MKPFLEKSEIEDSGPEDSNPYLPTTVGTYPYHLPPILAPALALARNPYPLLLS